MSYNTYIATLDTRQYIIYINSWNDQGIMLNSKYYNTSQSIVSNIKNTVNHQDILLLSLNINLISIIMLL